MIHRAGRVYEWERERAARYNHDQQYVVQIGKAASLTASRRALAAIVQNFQQTGGVGTAVETVLTRELQPVLVAGMVYGRLRGMQRAQELRPSGQTIAAALSPGYKRGIRFLRERLLLSDKALVEMERQAFVHVVRVLATATKPIQRRLMESVAKIHRKGLHVRDGVKALRKTWAQQGLTAGNPYQLEAIFRTQTSLAYAAGREEYLADPEIDELVWGFKLVTAGDDRVRPSHIAMDGITLPKGHVYWERNKTPNGYACRCQTLTILSPRKEVPPPDRVVIDGKEVKAEADEGFQFRPGKLLPPVGKPPLRRAG